MRSLGEMLLLSLLLVLPLCAENRAVSSGRDDVVYLAPAIESYEALPIGNGRLGAMVFGGVAEERLQLNENTLYSDEPRRRDLPLEPCRQEPTSP